MSEGMKEGKRKQPPGGGSQDRSKKSKKGNDGKWQTPNQRNNVLQRLELGTSIESGDAGIWVTCQRGLERKAIAELTSLCDELGETMYGIKPPSDTADEAALEAQSKGDIADTIAAELEELKAEPKKSKADHTFLPVRSGIECVFFMKTRSPVEPVAFVDRICDDAAACEDVMEQRKLRHINRLTPVVVIGKSLDKGLEKVGRDVLRGHLELNAEEGGGVEERAEISPHTYAIRPSIRASATLKRDEVINRVAALVSPKHKVNLGNPDKVILIEIFKNNCGMSIVDGSRFEKMKKLNINEIYKLAGKKDGEKDGEKDAGKNESVSKSKEEKDGAPGGKTGETEGEAEGKDEKTDKAESKPAGE